MKIDSINFKNSKNKIVSYRVILLTKKDEYNYVVYTNDKTDSKNNLVLYFAKYKDSSLDIEDVNEKDTIMLNSLLEKFEVKDKDE